MLQSKNTTFSGFPSFFGSAAGGPQYHLEEVLAELPVYSRSDQHWRVDAEKNCK